MTAAAQIAMMVLRLAQRMVHSATECKAGINAAHTWNQNGFTITIFVADGIYAPFMCAAIDDSMVMRHQCIAIYGKCSTTPQNCLIHATTGEAITVSGTDNYDPA